MKNQENEMKEQERSKIKKVVVNNLNKSFKIGFSSSKTFLSRIISIVSSREPKKALKAVDNVSFELNSGEIIGVIGANGSGKSTLLRLISGIYNYDAGEVIRNGKIISLINLGVGLKFRLTMKENIFLVGSFFGLSQKEIKNKFNSIVEFSELGDFVNTKVYQFSSGMIQRLAFSIAIYCNPEILLLDEVFEVGDEEFKRKSANKIEELVKTGACVVLVSHDLNMVEKYCDKVFLMHTGKIIKTGSAKKIIKQYKNYL
jgi:ABC-type polysaccharide/polyol phosphate transport system ATPase subunit